jgi:hypothetical protein
MPHAAVQIWSSAIIKHPWRSLFHYFSAIKSHHVRHEAGAWSPSGFVTKAPLALPKRHCGYCARVAAVLLHGPLRHFHCCVHGAGVATCPSAIGIVACAREVLLLSHDVVVAARGVASTCAMLLLYARSILWWCVQRVGLHGAADAFRSLPKSMDTHTLKSHYVWKTNTHDREQQINQR